MHKMIRYAVGIFLCVALVLSTNSARSADWKLVDVQKVTGSKYDTYYYVEMKSLKKYSSNKVRFWSLCLSMPQGSNKPTVEDMKDRGFKDYIEVDCVKKRYRSVKEETEAREGYVLISPINWKNIEPESADEKMAQTACRRK